MGSFRSKITISFGRQPDCGADRFRPDGGTSHKRVLKQNWIRTGEVLAQGLEQGLQLGAQVYVSAHGEPKLDRAIGQVVPGTELSRGHLLLWLSSSKPIAAVAIAQLWERQLVGLDDRIAEFIPEFGCRGKETITIRHLLTHTGGIRMLDVGWPNSTWDDIIEKISGSRLEPRWTPGTTAGYHRSASWFVLGELVRRLDGRIFEAYVRDEIFEPLQMSDSWIGMPLERFESYGARIAPLYDMSEPNPRATSWHLEKRVTRCSPGGNGRGPAHELGSFYEMLLAGGRKGANRVLRPQTVEAMTARHRVGLIDKTFQRKLDWGLGFLVDSSHYGGSRPIYSYGHHASRRTFGHSGYRSSTAFADPEHALAVVVLFNGICEDSAHQNRIDAVTTAIYEDLGLVG